MIKQYNIVGQSLLYVRCIMMHGRLSPRRAGCRVSRGLALCMLGCYVVSQVLVMQVSTGAIFPTPWM